MHARILRRSASYAVVHVDLDSLVTLESLLVVIVDGGTIHDMPLAITRRILNTNRNGHGLDKSTGCLKEAISIPGNRLPHARGVQLEVQLDTRDGDVAIDLVIVFPVVAAARVRLPQGRLEHLAAQRPADLLLEGLLDLLLGDVVGAAAADGHLAEELEELVVGRCVLR